MTSITVPTPLALAPLKSTLTVAPTHGLNLVKNILIVTPHPLLKLGMTISALIASLESHLDERHSHLCFCPNEADLDSPLALALTLVMITFY